MFAVLNSVERYRNGIFLGGRQPENEQTYCVRHIGDRFMDNMAYSSTFFFLYWRYASRMET